VVTLLAAAFLAVFVFLPAEGRIAGPLHDALGTLFGRATFVLPVGLALVGATLIVRRRQPQARLPTRRLIGVGALLLGVLPAEHALGHGQDGTGLVGEWLSATLVDLIGGPATVVLLAVLIVVGIFLTFEPRIPRVAKTPDAES
jgi:hypothetical protein